MSNCLVYLAISSETIHTNLKIFHRIVLRSVGRGYSKKK